MSDWRDQAACRAANPEMFFGPKNIDASFYDPARRVCASCTVRATCRDWALERREPDGMFGGLTPNERLHILKGRTVLA